MIMFEIILVLEFSSSSLSSSISIEWDLFEFANLEYSALLDLRSHSWDLTSPYQPIPFNVSLLFRIQLFSNFDGLLFECRYSIYSNFSIFIRKLTRISLKISFEERYWFWSTDTISLHFNNIDVYFMLITLITRFLRYTVNDSISFLA